MRIWEILRDERGNYSSNRFVGIIAGVTLCVCLVVSAVSHREITPSKDLIDAVMFICTGSLGFGMINKVAEKIYGKEEGQDNAPENRADSPQS